MCVCEYICIYPTFLHQHCQACMYEYKKRQNKETRRTERERDTERDRKKINGLNEAHKARLKWHGCKPSVPLQVADELRLYGNRQFPSSATLLMEK